MSLRASEGAVGTQVLDLTALKQAFGAVAIRRVKTNHNYVSALHLLPCLEAVALKPCLACKACEPLEVSPLAGLSLRQLSIEGYDAADNRVSGLAQLSSLPSLRLDGALPGNLELPGNLTDLIMVGYDGLHANVDPDVKPYIRVHDTLRNFEGHLQSFVLRSGSLRNSYLPDNLADLCELPCLQRLTRLNIVLRAESWADDAVLPSLPRLQSVTILISGGELSCCNFAAWPKLQKLDLICIVEPSSKSWDLTQMIGMRTRCLDFSILDQSSEVRMLTDFAGWGLEGAKITIRDQTWQHVPCKSSHLGRDLLGGLWSVLSQELVQVD